MNEEKDNTGLIIAIIIAVALLLSTVIFVIQSSARELVAAMLFGIIFVIGLVIYHKR